MSRDRSVFLAVGAGGGDALSFGHRPGLACAHIREPIDLTTGPANFDYVGFVFERKAKGQNEFAGGEVAGAAAKHLRLRFSPGRQPHSCPDAIAVGFCAGQLDAQTLVRCRRALCFIPKQIHRAAIGGEKKVQPAVVIEIGVGGAAPHSGSGEGLPE